MADQMQQSEGHENMSRGKTLDGSRRRKRGKPLTIDFFLSASMPEPNSGCWIWMRAMAWNGYGVIKVGSKTTRAHRAAYEVLHRISLPSNIDVCHKCDNRLCVNPEHLFAGTRADNMRDCSKKGRTVIPMLKGDDCPASKLNSKQVLDIRGDERASRAIAKDYGVTHGTILNIKKRKAWRHI